MNQRTKSIIRAIFDEVLRENFSQPNTLLHELRGEILELEFKNDEVMLQELLDNLDLKVKELEAALIVKNEEIINLQAAKINLEARISALEPKEPEP